MNGHEKRLEREPREVYDEIHLSYADMKRIFDPVVEDILSSSKFNCCGQWAVSLQFLWWVVLQHLLT
jgi:hypothetical protein